MPFKSGKAQAAFFASKRDKANGVTPPGKPAAPAAFSVPNLSFQPPKLPKLQTVAELNPISKMGKPTGLNGMGEFSKLKSRLKGLK